MFYGILNAVISAFIWLYRSPYVKALWQVIKNTVNDVPPDLWQKTFSLVLEAADKPMTSKQRYEWVYAQLRTYCDKNHPNLSENMLNALIENALLALKIGR